MLLSGFMLDVCLVGRWTSRQRVTRRIVEQIDDSLRGAESKCLNLFCVGLHDAFKAPVNHSPHCLDDRTVPFTRQYVQLLALRMRDKHIDSRPLVTGT
jgi:hypothetical protein